MDGTLTVAMHDFDAIRSELQLGADRPILEALRALPAGEQTWRRSRLAELELALAERARPALGAVELLTCLAERGQRAGILTRNSRVNTRVTLHAAGLDEFFVPPDIVTREDAPAKPAPDGIELLLGRWNAPPEAAVMLGDYHFDIEAAHAAGCLAVYVDASGRFPFAGQADLQFGGLGEVLASLR